MITDTELKVRGFKVLIKYLGLLEAERFITLTQRELFDYTHWRNNLWEEKTVKELSREAMEYRKQQFNNEV